MRSSSQVVGLGLIAAGVVIAALTTAWLLAGRADDDLEASGALLGGIFAFVFLVAPLAGAGTFFYVRGRSESRAMMRVSRQRRLLGAVEAAGEISIADLALETGATRDQVRADLFDLVSKGLFSGYVDWNGGRLFARQASELRQLEQCQRCGSPLSLAGKGLIRCPFCGTEYFLP